MLEDNFKEKPNMNISSPQSRGPLGNPSALGARAPLDPRLTELELRQLGRAYQGALLGPAVPGPRRTGPPRQDPGSQSHSSAKPHMTQELDLKVDPGACAPGPVSQMCGISQPLSLLISPPDYHSSQALLLCRLGISLGVQIWGRHKEI